MEAINARVRPMRSARAPKKNPPIADAPSVRELSRPAVRVLMPNSWMRYARTSEYSMTSMASSIQPRPPAIRDLRSAGEMSRGHANGEERTHARAGEGTSPDVIWSCRGLSVARVRGAIDTVRNAHDDQRQFQESARYESADKETNNSPAKTDEPLRGGFLEAQDNVVDDINAAAENPKDIENLYDAASELLLKREINQTRKEVLIVGHVASWQDFVDEQGFLLGTAIRRWMSRKFLERIARRYTPDPAAFIGLGGHLVI